VPEIHRQQRRYWRKTMAVTLGLLLIWFVVTFVTSYFSQWLNQWSFLGLPLGYFISAQGVLLIYLVLIGAYALWMNRLDRQFGVEEQ
jgi:putative solute:sodium symporter small subunit